MTAPVFGTKPRQRTIGLVATDPPSGLIALYNVPLPPCAIGIPRAWINKMQRRPA